LGTITIRGLRRGDDAADGTHGKLLHAAVDRGCQRHEFAAGVRLDQFLPEGGGFLLGVVECVQRGAPGFGGQRLALALGFGNRGGEFLDPAFLGLQVGFLFYADLFLFQVAVLGDEVLLHQALEVLGALAGDGGRLLKLSHDLQGRAPLRFALGDFGVDALGAGLVFAVLAVEDALFLRDTLDADVGRRLDARRPARGKRRQQGAGARRLQPRGSQVVGGTRAVGPGHRRVEFHQHLAGLDRLAVDDVNGLDGGGFDRLDQLAAGIGHDLALGHGDDVDVAEAGPEQRDHGKRHQQPSDDARRGRDRGFLEFQGGRKEGGLVRQARRRIEFAADLPDVTEDRGVAAQQVEGGLQAEGEGLGHFERP
jgi:hypothetical protein